jgi:colanic acid/amylovoran biosynthesis protein
MRALILWGSNASSNLGVRALGAGTEALLRQVDPEVEVKHQSYGPGDAPVRIGVARKQVRRLIRDTDGLTDWVRGFDVVLDTRGGDSFADIYGLPRLFSMNLMNEIVHRARVPVVFTPQTIGPFRTVRGELLGRRALSRAHTVMARDRVSAAAAARLGRQVDVLATDVVFAIDAPRASPKHDVLMNVSGLLWEPNPHVDHNWYRGMVIDFCEALLDSGRSLALLSHVIDSPDADNDVPASRRAADILTERRGARPGLLIPGSLAEVREQIASARLVVGSRMHACLNALSLGVPALPLSYSRKFAPLLEDLGWTAGLDIRTPDDGIVARAMASIDDPTLSERASRVRERAEELLEPVTLEIERAIA